MDAQYRIIGGDGVEYGPAALDELQDWIRDGRVARRTPVWRDDSRRWTPAEQYEELRPDLAELHARATAEWARMARPAGFWARLAGFLMDQILLIPLFYLLWVPISSSQGWQLLPPPLPSLKDQAAVDNYLVGYQPWANHALMIYFPLFMVYEVVLVGSIGATPGKLAIGARIRNADGTRLTYGRALIRWWAARLSQFLFFAGFLLIALRADKRALHDILTGTRVLYQ